MILHLSCRTCVCCAADSGLLKALAMMRLISTPVPFRTHIDRSHWIRWSGSHGLSQDSSSSHTRRGGAGRINSGRKWPDREPDRLITASQQKQTKQQQRHTHSPEEDVVPSPETLWSDWPRSCRSPSWRSLDPGRWAGWENWPCSEWAAPTDALKENTQDVCYISVEYWIVIGNYINRPAIYIKLDIQYRNH